MNIIFNNTSRLRNTLMVACLVSTSVFSYGETVASQKLTPAVNWQVNSKEYALLSRAIYAQATVAVSRLATSSEDWVAVLDVDETVLDNSQYQVNLLRKGAKYTEQTWNDWVTSEMATLVPGASGFITSLFAAGGKLALITNRARVLDKNTWANLTSVGLPINAKNTCLLGRTPDDIDAINTDTILNDKDLRRQQVRDGTAACFSPTGETSATWRSPKVIHIQIGDNIEDFAGVTQQYADVDGLLSGWNKQYFLLPNPMYGSWQ